MPRRFGRNLGWQYIANIGTAVIGGLYLLVLGRFLGAREFGLLSLSLGFGTLIFNCFDFRLQEATIKYLTEYSGKKDLDSAAAALRLFNRVDIGARLIAFTLLGCLAWPVQKYLIHGEQALQILGLVGVQLLLSKAANGPAVGVLRFAGQFQIHAKLVLFDWLIRLVGTTAIGLSGSLTVKTALVMSGVSACATNGAVILFAARGALDKGLRHRASNDSNLRERKREIRNFLASSQGISICDNAVRELDTTVIGWFLPLEAVGVYRMAKNFAMTLWRVGDPVFLVVMPEFAEFLSQGRKAELRAFVRVLTVTLALAAAAMVFAALFTVPLITAYALGPQFSSLSLVFPALSWWIVISLPLIWTHALAAAAGRPHLQLTANVVGNLIAVILLFLLTPAFGVMGAAMSVSSGLAITFVLSYWLLRRANVI